MKGLVFAAVCGLLVVGCAPQKGGELVFTGREVSVIIAPEAPDVTKFAAEELTNFLIRATGEAVPLVTALPTNGVAIVVGTNGWSAAAGVDPTTLKRDGFVIKTDAASRRVYIAGCDEPKFDMHFKVDREPADAWGRRPWERASVFGVYEFLERFVGCRFYFPGEIGTIVPSRPLLRVPAGTIVSEPDWRQRIVFTAEFGEWPDPLPNKNARWHVEQLEQLRLRSHSKLVRSCHGQYWANYAARYGQSHPEWFLKTKDGKRLNNPDPKLAQHDSQHLCQTSAIWDEIYKDAKAYLTGRPASERGAVTGVTDPKPGWGDYGMNGDLFDVMPHDGMHPCYCETCQAAYAKAKDPKMWADEIIWGQTAKVAQRLKDEGVKGWISQAAYASYRSVPDVEIPDNVVVNICERGPWSVSDPAKFAAELAEVKAWGEKVHGNVWTWTYVGKFECSNLNLPDVPMGTPRAFAEYYPKVAPYVFGVFPELGSEKFIFHHLDLYLYSRIAWDNQVDCNAVLKEYYDLMYGKGGPFVEKVFDEIERLWLYKIAGKTIDTPLGPASIPPSRHELFTEIYSPAKIAELEGFFAQGLASVPAGSMEAKRIAYMQEKIIAPLAVRVRNYAKEIDPKTELAWRAQHSRPLTTCDFSDQTGWARNSGPIGLDDKTFFSAPSSVKLAVTDTRGNVPGSYSRAQMSMGVVLQPGRTYRLSCFLKMDKLTPVDKIGGLQLLFAGPFNAHWGDPQGGPSPNGTRDWFPMVYEFTTPKSLPVDAKCPFYFRTILAHGTVWIDDVRIDEIGGGPVLTLGVFTDTHVGSYYTKDATHLDGAFKLFRDRRVDAIVNVGDIADRHDEKFYGLYTAEEDKFFPPGTWRPKRYFAYAWHDAFAWKGHPRNEAMKDQEAAYADARSYLGGDNAPNDVQVLNGIPFVFFYQWLSWDTFDYEGVLKRVEHEHPTGPILVFDHAPVLDTVSETHRGEEGNPCAKRREILNRHPRVIHFSGHKHGTLRDERNIWQGTFTAVNAACMQVWGANPVKHERGVIIAEIYEDRVVMRRFDTTDGCEIGADRRWTFPLPFNPKTAPYADAMRRVKEPIVAFPTDAKVDWSLAEGKRTGNVTFSFPEAGDATNRAAIYRIEAVRTRKDGTKEPFFRRVVQGDYYLRAEERTGRAECDVPSACFTPGTPYTVRVTPHNFADVSGPSLETTVILPKGSADAYRLVWDNKTPMAGAFKVGRTEANYEVVDGYFTSKARIVGRYLLPKEVVRGGKGRKYRIVADIRVKTQPGELYQSTVAGAGDPDYQGLTPRQRIEGGDGTLSRVVYEFTADEKIAEYCLYTFLDGTGASGVRFERIRVYTEGK